MIRFGLSVLFVGTSLMTTACGRKGPLIYPDMMVPAAPAAVSAQQSGADVKLQFMLSGKDLGGRPVQGLSGVKISRRVNETAQKDVCRSCTTDYLQFKTLYLDRLPTDTQRFGSRLVMFDRDVSAGKSYSYSIVPFTADGVHGSVSTTADVRVTQSLPAPVLAIESLPAEIRLQISSQLPITGRLLLGYNLYRRVAGSARSSLPINTQPVNSNVYVDTAIDRGVKYQYSARAVVIMASGEVAESLESLEVEGMLKDYE